MKLTQRVREMIATMSKEDSSEETVCCYLDDCVEPSIPKNAAYNSFLIVTLIVLDRLARNHNGRGIDLILGELERRSIRHPLLDNFTGKFIWAYKGRQEAIDFVKGAAERWRGARNRQFLFDFAALMERKMREDAAD